MNQETHIMNQETPETSYYQKRCNAIGLTAEKNKLLTPEFPALSDSKIIEYPLLCEDTKNGNIIIPVYDLDGHPAVFYKDNSGKLQNGKEKPFEVIRYKPGNEPLDKKGKPLKYNTPRGAKTLPWIAPNIIESYQKGKDIDTIILTEGYIKSISGYLNGFYIFGLAGIQNAKDKDTGTLHPCILNVINKCNVKNVILLYDGDANNISLNALNDGTDLYKRPFGFYSSANNINELLKDVRKEKHFDVYFASINSADLENNPKGLDDLFEAFPDDTKAITKELLSYSTKKPYYFTRLNITINANKVLQYLHINGIENFYLAHNTIIKEKQFVYHGTKYQYDEIKKECKVIIPGAAKRYVRVGDDYFEKIHVPNEYGKLEYRIVKRSKSTITDDHGKNIIEHISKFKDWCVVPNHSNFQEVIDNCMNSYHPFEWEASGTPECETTLNFIKHIFGNQYELGLDYIQLLYSKPMEKLPILSLVSKENKTGKSTFAEFLKAIFKGNMTTIGNDQLENNFNAGWATKLIICCEESFIDKKKTVEKIKSLSTGKKIEMEKKGLDTSEMAFFGKFILNSNNETNFTIVNEQDTRYWVVKVPVIQHEVPDLIEKLMEEIPNFITFLNSRHLSVPKKESRMWFDPIRLKTDALNRLVEGNISGPQKELTNILKNLFTDTGFWQLKFTLKYIAEILMRNRYERNYLERILKEKLNLKASLITERFKYPEIIKVIENNHTTEKITVNGLCGKPYVFNADQFLSLEELDVFTLSDEARFHGQEALAPTYIKERKTQLVLNIFEEIEQPTPAPTVTPTSAPITNKTNGDLPF